jgi:hypothetical protein
VQVRSALRITASVRIHARTVLHARLVARPDIVSNDQTARPTAGGDRGALDTLAILDALAHTDTNISARAHVGLGVNQLLLEEEYALLLLHDELLFFLVRRGHLRG